MNVNRFRFSLRGLTLCALLSPVAVFAQPANPDSLRVVADSLHAVGDSLLEIGKGYFTHSDSILDVATFCFEREVTIRQEISDTMGWWLGLNKIKDSYSLKALSERGRKQMEVALKALEIAIAAFGEADTLTAASYDNVAYVYRDLGDYQTALEEHKRSLAIRLKVLGYLHPDVGNSYTEIGWCYLRTENHQAALENYKRALDIYFMALDFNTSAIESAIFGLYFCYEVTGDYQNRSDYYAKLLENTVGLVNGNHPIVALLHNYLGEAYVALGKYQSALINFEKALEIQKQNFGEEHPEIARTYTSIGNLYMDMGDYQEAIEYYNKALEVYSKTTNIFGEEKSIFNVITTYGRLSSAYCYSRKYSRASDCMNKALELIPAQIREKHIFAGGIYITIADICVQSGDYPLALENFKKGSEIILMYYSEADRIVRYAYKGTGDAYRKLGSYQLALDNYRKALEIDSQWSSPFIAAVFIDVGNTYAEMGEIKMALENLNNALNIQLKMVTSEHPEVAKTYYAIGRVYLKEMVKDSALVYFLMSIEIFEKSRGKIESEELRGTYTETMTDRYEAIISLLLEMDRPEEAFEYLERSKSKALKDIIEEKYDLELGSGEIKEMIKQARVLATKIEVLGNQLLEERLEPDSTRNENKVENVSRLLDEVRAEYDTLVAEIEADPDYAFAVRVEPVKLSDIRKNLPEGQKLLMVYSGAEELYLFLVSREGYEGASVTICRDSLDNLITRYQELCGSRKARELFEEGELFGWKWEDDGNEFYKEEVEPLKNMLMELYSYLIEPLEGSLESAEIVTIIPSGNLYYLPWGALLDQDGDSLVFFTERYNWHVMTSTELLRSIQRREGSGRRVRSIALVGNPTGANLPGAADEVNLISDNYRRSTILQGEEATEEQVEAVSGESQVLHLATHARLKKDSPWESYIFLAEGDSSDGRWTVAEISGESWDKMQLVTLSACESGLGGKYPGLEFESVAKAFTLVMEGPPSIIATLSSVHDESTKELMVTFYEELKRNPKSEALRLAQQKLIHSGEYAHPFFWAPFILIGEWR